MYGNVRTFHTNSMLVGKVVSLHSKSNYASRSMGRHKIWRRIAKRERRRKLRIHQAKAREESLNPSSTLGESWIKEQEALDLFEYEQIEKSNYEENAKWMKAEELAMTRWNKLQEKIKRDHQERLEKEARLREEREEEEKLVREAKERLKQIEEEKLKQHEAFLEKLKQFLSGDAVQPPEELLISHETKPNSDICPFFSKTGCCRFGDQCSRNHRYPGVSRTVVAANFYSHFGLDNSYSNEYDTDVMLEFEDSDRYKEYKEFFYDVLPEFEKFGTVVQFKVCNNYERHLRGNTYVEFADLRSAVAAYKAIHSRWYGGRQVSLQFCQIDSWRNAICGLQSSRRCPKGRSCNFLHVFRNPDNMFNSYYTRNDNSHRKRTPPRRSWRWSESPEVEITNTRGSRSISRSESTRSHKSRRHRHRSERDDRHSSSRSHRSLRKYSKQDSL